MGMFSQFPKITNYPPLLSGRNNYTSDLCLLYCARPYPLVQYTKNNIKKYLVYQDENQKTQFIFDGFILFDIRGADNQPLENNPSAVTQANWTAMLDRYFLDGWAASAIDRALNDLKNENIVPLRKRQIYFGIPVPYEHNNYFGVVDGETMTMSTVELRVKAAKWFVEEVLKRWDEKQYQNIELAGFYYVEEHARDKGDEIIPQVADFVKSKGLRIVWIPYFGNVNKFAKDWKSLGFDMAYYQPNYFFVNATKAGVPVSRLDDATKFASEHGMAMEFEFDHNVYNDTLYQRKFSEYINYFEKNNVFQRTSIAYYEGGGAWGQIANSQDKDITTLYRRLCEIISNRQHKADSIYLEIKSKCKEELLYENFETLPGKDLESFSEYNNWKNLSLNKNDKGWIKKQNAIIDENIAIMSSSNKKQNTDAWFISPEINLENMYLPILSFNFACGNYIGKNHFRVLLTEDSNHSIQFQEKKWINIAKEINYPSQSLYQGTPSEFHKLNIDLYKYSGKKIQIAFQTIDNGENNINLEHQTTYILDDISINEKKNDKVSSSLKIEKDKNYYKLINNRLLFNGEVQSFSLFSMTGSLILYKENITEIDLNGLNGFYICTFVTPHELISAKLLIYKT